VARDAQPRIADVLDAVSARHQLGRSEIRLIDLELRHPADPRTARALMLLADVRTLAPIRALRATASKPWLAHILADTERHLAAIDPPALSEAAVAILDAIEAGEPAPDDDEESRSERALLAALHAAPADDAPRLVYADWLSERGDPRGELILLQCARARTGEPPLAREEELLARHTASWLGPLEPWVARAGARFARGFLDGVRLRAALPDALLDDTRLATVTTIEYPARTTVAELVGSQLSAEGRLASLVSLRTRAARESGDLDAICATPVGRRLCRLEGGALHHQPRRSTARRRARRLARRRTRNPARRARPRRRSFDGHAEAHRRPRDRRHRRDRLTRAATRAPPSGASSPARRSLHDRR
jgi:uncharacterized protein (TIGR02996 family)